jgi:hypothetical protein
MSKLTGLFNIPPDDDVHLVYHRFRRRFGDEKSSLGFKTKGHKLMKAIEQWAKRYPTEVQILSCDDSFYAGSMLVLIEHRSVIDYMGTTVVYVPQCTGEQPIEFFLYPERKELLIQGLKNLGGTRDVL